MTPGYGNLAVKAAAFNNGGHQLFLWSAHDNQIVVYDVATWNIIGRMDVGAPWPDSSSYTLMDISGDGRFLFMPYASSSFNGLISLDLSARLTTNQTGGDGNDVLWGTQGQDTISGGGGDDSLHPGAGSDSLTGGAGADTFVFSHGAGHDVVTDFDTTSDIIDLSGTDGFLSYTLAQSGNDVTITLSQDDVITLKNVQLSDLHDGNFRVAVPPPALPPHIEGTENADSLTGTDGDDLIYALGGADTINGGTGDDVVYGGDGRDVIGGGSVSDQLIGGMQDDTYVVHSADTIITELPGGGTRDIVESDVSLVMPVNVERLVLIGDANIDATGTDAYDRLTGNSGDNVILGLGGQDVIMGGDGNDIIDGGADNDTLDGGNGIDTVSYENDPSTVVVSLALGLAYQSVPGDTNQDIISNFENIIGTNSTFLGETLVGNDVVNQIWARAGDDRVFGNGAMTACTARMATTRSTAETARIISMAVPAATLCTAVRATIPIWWIMTATGLWRRTTTARPTTAASIRCSR